jgi:hypothetical protein
MLNWNIDWNKMKCLENLALRVIRHDSAPAIDLLVINLVMVNRVFFCLVSSILKLFRTQQNHIYSTAANNTATLTTAKRQSTYLLTGKQHQFNLGSV